MIYYQIIIFDGLYTYKEKTRIENRAYFYETKDISYFVTIHCKKI